MTDPAGTPDRGRAAVAAVEEAAFGGTDADNSTDRDVLHARLAAVVDGPWWKASGPPVSITTPRRSTRSSTARTTRHGGRQHESPVEIRLADGQLTDATVAHELAHALAGVHHGHDDRFRAAHVDVVALLCGAATAGALTMAYAAFGLVVGERSWPVPWRADGDTFRIVI